MNDDDLRDALRPPGGIEPLDPATVIAGARRRRRRGLAAGGAAAVAVLAVVAGSVLLTNGTSSSPVVDPVSTPTPTPARTTSPRPPVVDEAQVLTKCRAALAGVEGSPGPKAPRQAIIAAAEGTTLIVADSNSWAACDTGYRSGSALEVSVRQPGPPVRPGLADVDAFALAGNLVRLRGKEYDYYWAAGLVPAGVQTIRYTFPGGTTEDAVVTGKYWLMHHWSPAKSSAGKVRVRLLAANGAVLADFRLEPGVHTCAQISHGC